MKKYCCGYYYDGKKRTEGFSAAQFMSRNSGVQLFKAMPESHLENKSYT